MKYCDLKLIFYTVSKTEQFLCTNLPKVAFGGCKSSMYFGLRIKRTYVSRVCRVLVPSKCKTFLSFTKTTLIGQISPKQLSKPDPISYLPFYVIHPIDINRSITILCIYLHDILFVNFNSLRVYQYYC